MRVQHDTTLQAFYDRAAPFLQQREAEHNMFLSLMGDLLRQPPETPPVHSYYATVETDDGEMVAAAYYGGFRLMMSHCKTGCESAFDELLKDAASSQIDELVVPTELDHGVADTWFALTGRRLTIDLAARVYRLDTVKAPQNVVGTMRWATSPQDDNLMRAWMTAFEIESFGVSPRDIDEERLTRWLQRFRSGTLYRLALWQVDGTPVSMAATVGRSPHAMRIGVVYTPPEQRGQGYASALVAALSQSLLDSGVQFCTLNTDLGNLTSNKIYQAIGYYPVADQTMYEVEPLAGEELR